MRCFVGIPVPPEAREHLEDFLEPRRHAEPSLRWSAPERWHVTLAFLPDVADIHLDDLGERLDAACGRRRPLTMGLAGGGVFGGEASARVLWSDVTLADEDRTELDQLAVGVRNAAAAGGAVVEGGRFVPHVTVARSQRPRDLRHLLDVLDLYRGPTWEVGSVDLVESHIGRGPARHEVLGTYRLGPEPEHEKYWWRGGIIRRDDPTPDERPRRG